MSRPKMASSSGSDLEVEVRSGPASQITSGHEASVEPVVETAGPVVKEFVDLQGREIKIPERVLEVLRRSKDFQRTGSSSTCTCSQATPTC